MTTDNVRKTAASGSHEMHIDLIGQFQGEVRYG